MKTKEKQLLLKDLCSRLPYEPWVWFKENWETNPNFKGCQSQLRLYHLEYIIKDMDITLKPYLRPMSSMTDEESKDFNKYITIYDIVDWANAHHFDYRGLIKKGLALEAPEGMYKEE